MKATIIYETEEHEVKKVHDYAFYVCDKATGKEKFFDNEKDAISSVDHDEHFFE